MAFKVGDKVKCYYNTGNARVTGTIKYILPGPWFVLSVEKTHNEMNYPDGELWHGLHQGRIVRLVKKKK